jgi:nicotinate-nucleotide pyrophosphorylase (carboxylating)
MSDSAIELQADISADVRAALAEDIGSGDLSAALVPAEQRVSARVLLRQAAVICGQPWFNEVFRQLSDSASVHWLVEEGEWVQGDHYICKLEGPARALLSGERTALNFLQALSGTATTAHAFSVALEGTNTRILDTRKTIPGLRRAQKYAVRIGGASNHRMGLFDAVMIKENHIIACGGIEAAVSAAREQSTTVSIIVEVETIAEAEIALQTQANQLLLDDMSGADMRTIVALRDDLAPRMKLEASGGVTIERLQDIAATGVDFISIGSMTKHIQATDLSMRFEF